MSQQEFHTGKLRKISDNALQYAEDLIKEDIPSYCSNKLDYLLYSSKDKEYISTDNKLYEVYDHSKSDDCDFFKVDKNEDGTFSFIGSFYNGGTCLEDELEHIKDVD